MTSGTVVALGDFGRNLGAGMSGGEVYVRPLLARVAPRVDVAWIEDEHEGTADGRKAADTIEATAETG